MKKQVIAIGLAANLNLVSVPAETLNNSVINFEEQFIASDNSSDINFNDIKLYYIDRFPTLKLKEELIKSKDEEKLIEQQKLEEENAKLLAEQMEKERIANVQFDSYDIRVISGITYDEMATVLSGTGLEELSHAFVDAERTYGVNAFALAAIPALESGWNSSRRAKNGSNNLVGMDVTKDSDKGTQYSSKYDCIMDLAKQLDKYYLTPGAIYYNGPSTSDVNKMYCASSNWYKKIDAIGDELMARYRENYK